MMLTRKQELMDALHKLKRASRFDISDGELSRGECFLLQQIAKRISEAANDTPGVKISDLSVYAHMSKPAVSQMLNVLEDKGMIRRIMTKNDRRVVYVAPTDEGKAVLERYFQLADKMLDRLISLLGSEDTDLLIHLINRLYGILCDMKSEEAQTKEE